MQLKRTPLYEEHIKLGAKMVPFAGWEMPVFYPSGILVEHETVRNNCGIFDIGHMGVVDILGEDALPFIQYVATNDASLLTENECQYSILCNEQGGTIDDILVYRLPKFFRIVVNASNTDKALAHFSANSKKFKELKILHRQDISMLSLQGPKAKDLVPEFASLAHNHCTELVSRTGYTGEDGFEFFATREQALELWNKFISKKVLPCGLGARDTLRLEAGLPLYGNEYDDRTSPIEAGYSWAVKLNKPDFIGKAALEKIKAGMAPKKLVGLRLNDKSVPRKGFLVKLGGKVIGQVTSGTFSPTLKAPVALAYLDKDFAALGSTVEVEIRGSASPAVVSPRKLI